MRILHLTDTHVQSGLHNGLDTRAQLEAVLAHAGDKPACDLITITGDVSNDGSEGSYRSVADMVGDLAATWTCPVLYTAGNHDDAHAMTRVLDYAPTSTLTVGDVEILQAQTSVPMKGYGYLGERADWLAEHATESSIIIMHHPPSPPPTVLHGALALTDRERLAALLYGSGVRAILAGHYHTPRISSCASIPVVVGPATSNETTTDLGTNQESAICSAGYEIITVGEIVERELVRVPLPHTGQRIFTYSPAQVRAIGTEFGYAGWSETDPVWRPGIS